MTNATVLKMPVTEGQEVISEIYESWLSAQKRNSENTAKLYANRSQEFFEIVLGRNVGLISTDDILGIKAKDVQNYVTYLTDKGNSNNTISAKLNSVRSFFNELLKNNIRVNPIIFKTKLKKDVTHHQALTQAEQEQLYTFLLEEKANGLKKQLLAKFLISTAIRITATLNLKWEDIKYVKDDVYIIHAEDKGKKQLKAPISAEFYNEIKQLDEGQENVFDISAKGLERVLKRFSEKIGKTVVPHSLKATGIVNVYHESGFDIEAVRKFAHHENYNTTKMYLENEVDYTDYLSYSTSKSIDINAVDKLSHEDLLNFLNENQDIKRMIATRMAVKK